MALQISRLVLFIENKLVMIGMPYLCTGDVQHCMGTAK
jgi:hypothetical protein